LRTLRTLDLVAKGRRLNRSVDVRSRHGARRRPRCIMTVADGQRFVFIKRR
jgi:hypothetical protein